MDCCNYMPYRQTYYDSVSTAPYYDHMSYFGELYGHPYHDYVYGTPPYYTHPWQCAASFPGIHNVRELYLCLKFAKTFRFHLFENCFIVYTLNCLFYFTGGN